MTPMVVVGAGLAGAEAAYQLAAHGVPVTLFEARPQATTPAHQTDQFAELVCSNSLGSEVKGTAKGLLVAELEACDSMIVRLARATVVPAGMALAVDRHRFAAAVTEELAAMPGVTIRREIVDRLPEGPAIVATGPLTIDPLAQDLARLSGREYLHFYDATSPIVDGGSIDREIAFMANRRSEGVGDYLNCPLNEDEYRRFLDALLAAELVTPHGFEDKSVFEGCMPIEQIARRGEATLRFGPMRPVGLDDPRTGRWPFAVVQLRREDAAGEMWNLVGFQTRMKFGAQREVLRLIPGLENAEFLRYGVIHRNTYVDGPRVLEPDLSLKDRPNVWLAGQITGVEGYLESVGMGLLAAHSALGRPSGWEAPPETTMLGALVRYVTQSEPAPIQPMNANFGLLPHPGRKMPKRDRKIFYHERGVKDLQAWYEAVCQHPH